jgi:amidase
MVPAALGTQTAGSIIRPAAYCGIVGFKPSHGLLSLEGIPPFAPSLDTLGVLVREVATSRRCSEPSARQCGSRRSHACLASASGEAPGGPYATSAMQARLEEVAGALTRAGAAVHEVDRCRRRPGCSRTRR